MSEVKKYSHDERAAIIEEHRKWRFGEGGKRADLSRADLSSADLSSADLSRANLSSANLYRANLSSANLYRANLSSADLYSADLYSANLSSANLSSANLSSADLSSANLSSANLSSADLSRANLSSANLSSANLYRAKFNFQSHTLIAEVLRRAAGEDVEKRKVAGLILVSPDWCWDQFTANCSGDPLFGWALEVLRGYITEDDGHPAMLDKPVAGGVPL
jgi:uncharacterized protein YjbI with pentapeptide repeats